MAMQGRHYSNLKKHIESSIVVLTQRPGHFQNAPLDPFLKKKTVSLKMILKMLFLYKMVASYLLHLKILYE